MLQPAVHSDVGLLIHQSNELGLGLAIVVNAFQRAALRYQHFASKMISVSHLLQASSLQRPFPLFHWNPEQAEARHSPEWGLRQSWQPWAGTEARGLGAGRFDDSEVLLHMNAWGCGYIFEPSSKQIGATLPVGVLFIW